MIKKNLYNETHKKTRQTIEYIKQLQPLETSDYSEILKFNKIKTKALEQDTANAMLEIIGYDIYGLDMIFIESSIKKNVVIGNG